MTIDIPSSEYLVGAYPKRRLGLIESQDITLSIVIPRTTVNGDGILTELPQLVKHRI